MNLDLFMFRADLRPTPRWQDAFPEGLRMDLDGLMPSLDSSDVVWLPSSLPQWQSLLQSHCMNHPGVAIVVVSSAPDELDAQSAFEAGARGYCHAFASAPMLREVSLVVRHGGLWVGPALMARVLTSVAKGLGDRAGAVTLEGLSARESEVAREVADGLSNREIAWRLGVTERTVKAHLGAIFTKLDVRDRLQLALKLASASATKGGVS